MRCNRNIAIITVFAALYNAWAFVPVLLPYYQEKLHLGYQGLLLGESFFAAVCVLLDVPTGWISDVWKRKYTLALGAAANAVGSAFLLAADSLWGILIAQLFYGIGVSLANGTQAALLYESLLPDGRQDEYRKRDGKRQGVALYGIAVAGTLSGFAYTVRPWLPIALTLGAHAMAALLALKLDEPEHREKKSDRHAAAEIMSAVKDVLKGRTAAGVVILFAALLFSATRCLMWAQQPYYMAMHIPTAWMGLLMSLGWVTGGASSHMAHLLDGKVNNYYALAGGWAIAIFLSLVAAAQLSYGGIVALLIGGSCIYGTVLPRVNEIINRSSDASNRATLLSTQTFLSSMLFIPVSNLLGAMVDHWSIQPALLGIAAWTILAGGALLYFRKDQTAQVLKEIAD